MAALRHLLGLVLGRHMHCLLQNRALAICQGTAADVGLPIKCCVCLGLGEFPGPLVGRVAGVVGARQIRPATPVGWLVGLIGGQRQIMKN